MPTFNVYVNGKKVESMRGADAGQLETMISKWAATAAGPGGGAAESPVAGQVRGRDGEETVESETQFISLCVSCFCMDEIKYVVCT